MKSSLLVYLLIFSQLTYGQTMAPPPSMKDVQQGNLTDQQRLMMDDYVHHGQKQRIMDETIADHCKNDDGEMDQACLNATQGMDATSDDKFMGMSPDTVKMLSQVYTMIIGMGGLGGSLDMTGADKESNIGCAFSKLGGDGSCSKSESAKINKENTAAAKVEADKLDPNGTTVKESIDSNGNTVKTEVKNSDIQADANAADKAADKKVTETSKDADKKEDEKKEDYCKYIAVAAETAAQFTQQTEQEHIIESPSDPNNVQIEALQKQSRTHAARDRSIKWQTMGWGATFACYTVMMIGPASMSSWGNWLKLGGSLLLWRYFEWERDKHQEAKATVDAIIAKMKKEYSKAGNCNPISERDCYCSEPTTMNDPQYCLPQMRKRSSLAEYQVTCVNGNLKEDPACACLNTNSCADQTIVSNFDDIHIPQIPGNVLSPYMQQLRGNSTPGRNGSAIDAAGDKLFAYGKNFMRNNIDKLEIPESIQMTPSAKKTAGLISDQFGIPKKMAMALAAAPAPAGSKKYLGKFRGGKYSPRSYRSRYNRKAKGVTYRKKRNSRKKSYARSNPFGKKSKSASSRSKVDVFKFGKEASHKAGIIRNKTASIFMIISQRYKKTAKRRLDVTE